MFLCIHVLQNACFLRAHTSTYSSVAACLQVVGGVPGQQEALVSRVSAVRRPWARQASGQGQHLGAALRPRPEEQRQESGLHDKGREKTHPGFRPCGLASRRLIRRVFWSRAAQDGGRMCQSVKTPPTARVLGSCRTQGGAAKPWNVSTVCTTTPPHARQIKAAYRTHNISTDLIGRDSNVPKDTDMAELVHVKVLHLQKTASFWVVFVDLFYSVLNENASWMKKKKIKVCFI